MEMRKIKFRAKRLDYKWWVEGYVLETPLTAEVIAPVEDGHFFLTGTHRYCISKDGCVHEIDFETIGQFTGLVDKNSVEIWEGDIIHAHIANVPKSEHFGVVVFRGGRFSMESRIGETGKAWVPLWDGVQHISQDKSAYMDECEVIGNIFDNPELLKS